MMHWSQKESDTVLSLDFTETWWQWTFSKPRLILTIEVPRKL
jgi:hypothetical protein